MAVATLSIDVEARLAKLEEGLDKASRVVQKSAGDMQRRFDGINSAALALSRTLLTGFAVTGLALFTREALRGLDALNDFKDATGASIENASALEDVAARTGTSFDAVSAALVRLNKVLGDAKSGSAQANLLKSIGLNAEELRRIDPAEALQRVATALNRYEDSGNKARLIQELFGKSVREVAPLLKDLAENGKLVATVTTEQAEQAERFNKQLDSLSKSVSDIGRQFASALLPQLNKAAEDFKNSEKSVLGFVKALNSLASLPYGGLALDKLGNIQNSSEVDRLKQIAVGLENVRSADERAGRAENESNSRRLAFTRARIEALQTIQQAQSKFEPGQGVNPSGLFKPDAPGIPDASGAAAKIAKLPEIAGAANTALQAALSRLGSTDFAKIEALRDELEELVKIRDALGSGGGVDQSIADITEELERLSPAAQAAAESQKRLNDLLADTPSGRLDVLRRDMEFLADAFERGQISAEQFSEAAQSRLGTLPDTFKQATDEMEEFSKQAARNIQDALGSGVRQVLSGEFDNIGDLFKNLLLDIAAQAISANISNLILGDFGKTGNVGGLAASFFSLFSANGNVFDRSGVQAFASGDVFGSPTGFGFGNGRLGVMGEAGPEAVMPLKRGRDGKLGVAGGGMSLSQTYYIGQGVQMGQVVSAVQQGNRELLEQLRAAGKV